jgi:glycosyltransferase involved in cell wall biosynthesis
VRIFFWCDAFRPNIGGVEELAWQFLNAMCERGYRFTVLTHQDDDCLPDVTRHRDITIHRLAFRRAFDERNPVRLLRLRKQAMDLAQSARPDLVHLYFVGYSAAFLLPVADRLPAPMLVTLHNDLELQDGESTLAAVLARADWVTGSATVSSSLDTGQPYLLCARRLVRDKGVDLAIAMMSHVRARFPGFRLVIAGSGPERETLERQSAELGLADAVDFLGPVTAEDMPRLIRQASIVLLPSRREGLPLIALEAAWMKRPVVGTTIGGIPEFVVDGHNGFLVAPEDPAALAEAVCEMLGDDGRIAEMGRAAHERVRAHFSWQEHVSKYDDLYRRLSVDKARSDDRTSC